jgi:N-formylglutamate amidohydrolase
MNKIEPVIFGKLERPLIVIIPHSSDNIPEEISDRLAIKRDELYGETSNLGGVLIVAPVSRFVVQLNKKTTYGNSGLKRDERESDGSYIRTS